MKKSIIIGALVGLLLALAIDRHGFIAGSGLILVFFTVILLLKKWREGDFE